VCPMDADLVSVPLLAALGFKRLMRGVALPSRRTSPVRFPPAPSMLIE
jgi:hypothetical protein